MQSFKIKSLKKISAIVAATVGFAAYQPAQATAFTVSGRLNNTGVKDSALGANSFSMVGVSSLGNCGVVFGFVIFIFKDDLRGQQMYATALAAAASGSTVFATVEDTNRDATGLCYATSIGIVGN